MLTDVTNWARYPKSCSTVLSLSSALRGLPALENGVTALPFGMGRSLGDSCLNDGQVVLVTTGMNAVLRFDASTGLLDAEAGITFDDILRFAIPAGWFLPVTPGTRYVTLGGAIANDVHGKNHHVAATFGHHVRGLELLRSDGSRVWCSPRENAEWFRATVGGLGLTGLITRAQLQLKPVVNSWIDAEAIRFGDINEFYALTDQSAHDYEYVVAWVDTLSTRTLGRGVLFRGNHSTDTRRSERAPLRDALIAAPPLPFQLLSNPTIRLFNNAFYWLRKSHAQSRSAIAPFFYPLDALGAYHRIYGPKGMLQWQALLPHRDAVDGVLRAARRLGGSFLSVVKVMGGAPNVGLMSFSGAGVTIALDFPYSDSVLRQLPLLDELVRDAGGRLYPAKDARMSGAMFRATFPQWSEFERYIDPRFSSSFWRRVMIDR